MTRGVRQVRRTIKQRKKQREQLYKNKQQQRIYPSIQEEEKHGFGYPNYNQINSSNKKKSQRIAPNMTLKISMCVVFFILSVFIITSEHSRLQPTKEWVVGQLEDDFPFARAKSWYESTFGGTPLSIAPQGSVPKIENENYLLPVTGQVVETFHKNGEGIMISPSKKSVVTALDEGIVIFAGKDQKTGKTVTIQHADGSNTTYGHLSAIDVHGYQMIEANQRIGSFKPSEESEVVYFSIEKDKEYVDPAQVIPVDDLP